MLSTHVYGRELQNITPIEAPNSGQGNIVEQEDAALHDDEKHKTILVARLNGLRFVIDQTQLVRGQAIDVSGVEVKGVIDIDEQVFTDQFMHYIGQPVSLNLLDAINADTIKMLAEHDYPAVDVFAAQAQDITNGVVQISIVIGQRGKVLVRGDDSKTASLASQLQLAQDAYLTRSQLEADVAWLNRNPFRRVDVLLQRGEDFGYTDLLLDVQQDKPYRFYTGVDDTGTELTKRERWFVGANIGNMFGLDHLLNYRYTSAFDKHSLKAHSFNYDIPIHAWQHHVSLFGAYVTSKPDETGSDFQLNGRSWQLGLRYHLPLPQYQSFKQQLSLGADYKRSNNDLNFGAVRLFDSFTTVAQLMAAYTVSNQDRFGRTQLGIETFISPGGFGDGNEDEAFNESRAEASGDYVYGVLNLNRVTQLPLGLQWHTGIEAQLANKNLIGSEQIGLGGFQSVRGYDEYLFTGDKGLIMRNEIFTPAYRVLRQLDDTLPNDQLKLLWFVDYGVVDNIDRLPGEQSTRLSATGLGLRYAMGKHINFRLDYGWQLKKLDADINDNQDGRFHASLVIAY